MRYGNSPLDGKRNHTAVIILIVTVFVFGLCSVVVLKDEEIPSLPSR